jgi:hypothetical protein
MIGRLFADFNGITRDEFGEKVAVGKQGSWQIERYRPLGWLVPGSTVKLSDGELEVVAILELDATTDYWYGRPDWATRRDLSSRAQGVEELRQFPPDKRLIIIRNELDILIRVVQAQAESLSMSVAEVTAGQPIPSIANMAARLTDSTKTLREVFDALTDPDEEAHSSS